MHIICMLKADPEADMTMFQRASYRIVGQRGSIHCRHDPLGLASQEQRRT